MKLFAAAAIVLLSLASSFSYAEQTTTPVRQNQRDTMILPSEHNDSPFDFNHMAAGNIDQSDELWRAVLPAARPVMPLHAYLWYSPSPGLFLPARHARPHQTQTENVDIEPGHDQRRPGELQSAQRLPQQQRSWPIPTTGTSSDSGATARFHSAPAASPRYHSRRGWR